MVNLGVNVDHVATVRQARRESFPDPVTLALQAVQAGAHGITAHLREDRRHIQDDDIWRLKKELPVPLNLEMATSPEIVSLALDVKPAWVCLVPEKRQELTTEGGLDVVAQKEFLSPVVADLRRQGIRVSLFIEAEAAAIEVSSELKADAVELHTGAYARVYRVCHEGGAASCSGTSLSLRSAWEYETNKIVQGAKAARALGLQVHAGHGLDYGNAGHLAGLFDFYEFNIGFAIIARALEVGMATAVSEMRVHLEKKKCAES